MQPRDDETIERLRDEVRQAYADAYRPASDEPLHEGPDFGYDDDDRCLKFLASEFVPVLDARELVNLIGPYNAFEPANVRQVLERIEDMAPGTTVAVGREFSPVLYFATGQPAKVKQYLDEMGGAPDELDDWEADRVGPSRHLDSVEPHDFCAHDYPPVDPGDEAAVPPGNLYVIRAWWD